VVSSTPGLCRLLSVPAGRRTFPTLCCASFPACLDPYPGGSCGARTRFFPHDSGLPPVRTGSALHNVRTATSVRHPFRGCSHSLMFRPAGLLATPVAPTDITHAMWQPWLLRPSLSRFVTSPCPGYANRPNRAIDGMGTFTPSDTQPCRLLPATVGTPVTQRPPCSPGRAVFPHPVPRLHSHPRRLNPCLLWPAGRLAHTDPVRHVRDECPFRAACFRRDLPHVVGFPHLGVLRSIRLPNRIWRAFPLPVLLRLPRT
jgi:hypothetical protein